jgi:RHS repeat-associated protein
MAMKKRFYSVNGQMMGYESGGVKKDFLTDHLGSITAEIDQNQNRTFETRYSAYGRNNWSTGTGCGFGWVGSYGYRETGLFHMSHYVRARHYSYLTGNWSTVDPLWPDESAYGYVLGSAPKFIDPTGLAIVPLLCAGACVGAGGCGLGIYIACKDWSPAYDSFAECALEFVKDLPIQSQVGCLVSAVGCFACIVKYAKEACKKVFDGKCTPAEWDAWTVAIHIPCDMPRSCDPRNKKYPLPPYDKKKMCDFIMPRLENGTACVAARVGRQIACYETDRNPGEHMKQIKDNSLLVAGCMALALKYGCFKK